MISLIHNKIILDDKEYAIESNAVWFQTPFGLFTNLGLALAACKASDMNPELCVRAVAVAVGDIYEVYP